MILSGVIGVVLLYSVNAIWGEDKALGPATVIMKRVEQCPDPETYPFTLQVERRKLSRTKDAFSGNLSIEEPMDQLMGAYLNAAKMMDGGWKPNFYVLEENQACDALMKWVEGNFKVALEEMGAPPECPLNAGFYTLNDYVIDYEELPENLTYGEFQVDAFLTKAKRRMLCIRFYVDIDPKKEE